MTTEDYLSGANTLAKEMERVRNLLDQHAINKPFGAANSYIPPPVRKAYSDLENIVERIKALERAFWGDKVAVGSEEYSGPSD